MSKVPGRCFGTIGYLDFAENTLEMETNRIGAHPRDFAISGLVMPRAGV
jgi:hypothetical protein